MENAYLKCVARKYVSSSSLNVDVDEAEYGKEGR